MTHIAETDQVDHGAVRPIRVAFALPGLHREIRGAEVALESIATELAARDGFDVTLFGSGEARDDQPYRFVHVGCVDRRWFARMPGVPFLRDNCWYEELTFVPGFLALYEPSQFDVTVACSYPYLNWILSRSGGANRPRHVFVTQNGDWPAQSDRSEFGFFQCDALVCTNPDYYETNRQRWNARLIPNGVDPARFSPGEPARAELGLPTDGPIALMVSALIDSKRVIEGIDAAAEVEGLNLVVAGDGPLRESVQRRGEDRMGSRFRLMRFGRDVMPQVYRSVDVMLHMSMDEPSSNAYLEALATGLPIVTHDRAVTRWTFDGQARLVNTTDRAAVVSALKAAVAERSSSNAASEQVAARRELARRRFAWSSIADEYAELLRQVCHTEQVAEGVVTR